MIRMRVSSLAPCAGLAAAVMLGGCGHDIQNVPQPSVTQVERAANDALVITAVKAKLITVDVDSTASLGVKASAGVVTLTGAVRSEAARAKTVAAARSVTGVREVRDQLRIDPRVPNVQARLTDAALAGRIAASIFTQTGSGAVHVDVHNGVVTLRGNVTDPKIRNAAVDTARNTTGVHSVVDQMGAPG